LDQTPAATRWQAAKKEPNNRSHGRKAISEVSVIAPGLPIVRALRAQGQGISQERQAVPASTEIWQAPIASVIAA
jgi:hypothetical protein